MKNNPEGAELQTTETSVKGEGTASFGNITFTKAGTYKFYLSKRKTAVRKVIPMTPAAAC